MQLYFFMLLYLTSVFRVVFSFHEVYMEYYFIDLKLNWSEAQQYCRKHYTDLATISNMEELGRLKTPSAFSGDAWIGLSDDPASWKGVMGNDSNSWRWSATGTTSPGGYQRWRSGEPNNWGAVNYCVHVSNGLWMDAHCGHTYRFACFSAPLNGGSKHFTLVSTQMSWEKARSHCRQHYTDLAMIEDETEFTTVASLHPSAAVWIGLYREPWRWSDGNPSKFTNWANGQPDNYGYQQHCVKVRSPSQWFDTFCYNRFSFHCEKALERKRTHVFKVTLHANVDLTDPAVSTVEQIKVYLLNMGLTDVNLKWKIQRQKEKNNSTG